MIKLSRYLFLIVLFLAIVSSPVSSGQTTAITSMESHSGGTIASSPVHRTAISVKLGKFVRVESLSRNSNQSESTSGGDDPQETTEFNWNMVAALLLTLAAMVPTLGGSVGGVVGLLVDVIKATLLIKGKYLPDNWGGYIAIILNAVFWIALFIILKNAPSDMLPENVEQWFKIGVTALTFLLTFLTQLQASGLTHRVLVNKAPNIFSISERKRREALAERGVDLALVQG